MISPELHAASYVPALVGRGVALDPTPRRRCGLERFPAAALFADISGFTPLASRLAARGPAGAEELGRVLNAYFGRLLALIDAHGGEAVKFAGDALLALWPVASDEDLATAVCRAGRCGLAVQGALEAADVGEGVRLSLHAGIGAGEALALHVGGVAGRWYLVAAGEPVRQSGAAVGRRHPFMLLGALLSCVAFYELFSPPQGLSTPLLFAWFIGWNLLVRLAGSLFAIPYLALGAELRRTTASAPPSPASAARAGCWAPWP